jgi:hypothetical protein
MNSEWGLTVEITSYRDLKVWKSAIGLAERETTGAFTQFLRVAQGSLKELETHIILARRLDLAAEADDELGRMLRGLIRSLQQKTAD